MHQSRTQWCCLFSVLVGACCAGWASLENPSGSLHILRYSAACFVSKVTHGSWSMHQVVAYPRLPTALGICNRLLHIQGYPQLLVRATACCVTTVANQSLFLVNLPVFPLSFSLSLVVYPRLLNRFWYTTEQPFAHSITRQLLGWSSYGHTGAFQLLIALPKFCHLELGIFARFNKKAALPAL